MAKKGDTWFFEKPVYIRSWASCVGTKEGEGPLGADFDIVGKDNRFGQKTWEQAEKHMQQMALDVLAEFFGADRKISLCRELTKLHEEVVRTTLGEAIEKYTANAPKGEFVLVVDGAAPAGKEVPTAGDAGEMVKRLMGEGLSRKDAIKQTAKALDLPKNVVYDAALAMDE